MIIKTNKGTLKVGRDTQISLKLTNAIIGDQGSHSLPFTVPWCNHNLKVLGFLNRHHNANTAPSSIPCTIQAENFFESGSLDIISTAQNQPIELSFITREGAFWKWAKETQLRDINIPDYDIDLSEESFQATLSNFIDDIWPQVDFAFFPLAIADTKGASFLDTVNDQEIFNNEWYADRKHCLANYMLINNPGDLYRNDNSLHEHVRPIPYTNAILQWIANTYGFRVNDNFLASSEELRRCVTLSASTGYLWSDYHAPLTLPKVTVMEYISSLEDLFCCRFFINPLSKSINIVSFNQILASDSKNLNANLSITSFIDKKSVSLSASRISSPYTKVDDSFPDIDWSDPYNNYDTWDGPITNKRVYISSSGPDWINNPDKIVYSTSQQTYFYFKWHENGDTWEYIPEVIHTNYHDLKNTDHKSHEVKSKAHFVPMVPVICRQFDKNGESVVFFTYNITTPLLNSWDNNSIHDNGLWRKNESDAPLAFAFNRGRVVNIDFGFTIFGKNDYDMPFASVDLYDENGNELANANIALRFYGEKGLRKTFYENFDKFLEYSNVELDVSHATIKDILAKSLYDKIHCNDLDILLDEIEISISPFETKLFSVKARPLKPVLLVT